MTSHLKLPSKTPHRIGETLVCQNFFVDTCLFNIVKLLLEASEAKMRRISLYSDTIQRRISDMPEVIFGHFSVIDQTFF